VLRRIGGDASTVVRLFSCGTLQQPQVQRATFRRELDPEPDRLTGYRTDWITIAAPDVIAASAHLCDD
jgi:hypothetical protein